RITGVGLATFAPAKKLTGLGLANTKLTDQGMVQVCRLTTLQTLDIGRTQITDASAIGLKNLKELTHVYLYETATSDITLGNLQGATKLQRTRVGAQASDAGMAALQKILPKCKIER